jgi:hypothetical protein
MADGDVPQSAGPWRRHDPTSTLLHAIVVAQFETFRRAASEGAEMPRYVTSEFEAFVRCGVLACGFARARCGGCGADQLVAFSRKKRGVCPWCGGRRMSEKAAELVDRVLPEVPVRQWVLSLPWSLRMPVARDPALLTKVSRIVFEAIRAHLRAKAGGAGAGERIEAGAVYGVPQWQWAPAAA